MLESEACRQREDERGGGYEAIEYRENHIFLFLVLARMISYYTLNAVKSSIEVFEIAHVTLRSSIYESFPWLLPGRGGARA